MKSTMSLFNWSIWYEFQKEKKNRLKETFYYDCYITLRQKKIFRLLKILLFHEYVRSVKHGFNFFNP